MPIQPLPAAAAVQIPESTRWQIDSDIVAAATAATESARRYARGAVDDWRSRVARRTEAEFIPWLTDYWTQQWLTIKMAWYRLNAEEGGDGGLTKLAVYLEEQYQERVLRTVAREVDPDAVRDRATRLYVQSLAEQLHVIPLLNGLPQAHFDQRLKEIPAIAPAGAAGRSASLYQIIHADPLDRLPAYTALIGQIRKDAGGSGRGGGPLNGPISPMARRTSEQLAGKLAGTGGAGAAAAVFGGVVGMMISLGAAGIGAFSYEQERPALEAELRQNLGAALDEMSLGLMEDRRTGVLAGVYALSGQIEQGIPRTVTRALILEPARQEIPSSAAPSGPAVEETPPAF